MSIKILDLDQAITMPWKNGGGVTTELYRIDSPNSPGEFIFRISMATVGQSGPFSIFPNIDRTLLLINGKGMNLQFDSQRVILDKPLTPISFYGEDSIYCELISGECTDFNIMVDRRYGKANLEISSMPIEEAKNIVSSSDIFLFQANSQNLFIITFQTLIR